MIPVVRNSMNPLLQGNVLEIAERVLKVSVSLFCFVFVLFLNS